MSLGLSVIFRNNYGKFVFQELAAYTQEQGNCLVPARWQENIALSTWISGQRSRRAKLDAEKSKRLDELGFVWDTRK